MPSDPLRKQGQGIALGFVGGGVLSFDIPVIRLAGSDPWLTMCVRGLCLAAIFALFEYLRRRRGKSIANLLADRDWLFVGFSYGISNIFFTLAVFNIPTASLVFILAFNPMIAALFSWWMMGERPARATWAAIVATIIGVAIIVADGLGQGTWFGAALAVATTVSLAYTLVYSRRSGKDMSLAPGLGGAIVSLFALPFALSYSPMPGHFSWLLVNGLMVLPVATFSLALAPKFIAAPQVAIFYLLETVLAPIWIWLIFAEEPTARTLIGGAVVLVAILAHSLWSLSRPAGERRPLQWAPDALPAEEVSEHLLPGDGQ